jgi:hypothetical protein
MREPAGSGPHPPSPAVHSNLAGGRPAPAGPAPSPQTQPCSARLPAPRRRPRRPASGRGGGLEACQLLCQLGPQLRQPRLVGRVPRGLLDPLVHRGQDDGAAGGGAFRLGRGRGMGAWGGGLWGRARGANAQRRRRGPPLQDKPSPAQPSPAKPRQVQPSQPSQATPRQATPRPPAPSPHPEVRGDHVLPLLRGVAQQVQHGQLYCLLADGLRVGWGRVWVCWGWPVSSIATVNTVAYCSVR